MNRLSGTIIAGCAFTAIAVAVSSASADAQPFHSSDAPASAKDGGIAIEFAKDGGALTFAAAKDGGSILSAKEGGAAP